MKITSDKEINEIIKKGKKNIKKTLSTEVKFQKVFMKTMDKAREQELKDMLDEIENYGKDLLFYKNAYTLKRYKKKVRAFLEEILKDYEHKNVISSVEDESGKRKIYHIVEHVNNYLDSLKEEALSQIKEKLNLVATMDELRGLMLDVFG